MGVMTLRDFNGRFIKGNKGFWLNKKRGVSPKKIEIEPELLESLYWGNQLGIVEISKFFNCEYKVIWRRMKEQNIPIRNNSDAQKAKLQNIEQHWNWKGGLSRTNYDRCTKLPEYVDWRNKIFKKDNYTCQLCHHDGRLNAHHIASWNDYPDKRYDTDNGITLCKECHIYVHKYKWGD